MLPEHQQFLMQHSTITFFPEGTLITGPEDGVADKLYIIKQGRVQGFTKQNASNDEQVWELITGEAFPIGALLSRRQVRTSHRTAEDTYCYVLTRDNFETLLDKSRIFHDFCTHRLANLLEQAVSNIQSHTATTVTLDNSLNTSLRNLLATQPVYCQPDTSIRLALEQIDAAQRRSIAVVDANQKPVGILTLRDVMSRVTLTELDIDKPISVVMSPVEYTLSPDNFAWEAALSMAKKGIGHVCVVEHGKFIGLLSERDLFSLQRIGLGNLSRAIQLSDSMSSLKMLSQDIIRFTDQMLAQGASVIQLMRLITTLNDRLTERVITLCEKEHGKPAINYTWLAFGSEGRMEQTLKTDQDNGILFDAEPAETEAIRQQLLPLAKKINHALADVGFPLCPGNIMASNPACCLSKQEWQTRFDQWISSATPENLLNASIYFDFRPLSGPTKATDQLREWLLAQTAKNSLFRQHMAVNALRTRPPLGLFGDFVTQRNENKSRIIDLKLHGITPFVDTARILALANHIPETNTIERLTQAADHKAINSDNVSSWIEAYQYIQLLRMQNHHQQSRDDISMSNEIEPDSLNDLEQRILKETFRQARKLQSRLSLDYQL